MKTNSLRLIPSPVSSAILWFGVGGVLIFGLFFYAGGPGLFLVYALLALYLGWLTHHMVLAPRYGRAFRFQDWEGAWQEPTVFGAGRIDAENGYLVSRDWRGRERRRWPLHELTEIEASFRAYRGGIINWEFRFQFGAQSFEVNRSFYILELHHSTWFFRSPRKRMEKWFAALPVIRDSIFAQVRGGAEVKLPRPYAELHESPLLLSLRPAGLTINGEAVAAADLLLEGRSDAPDIRLITPRGIGFLARQDRQSAKAYALLQLFADEMRVKEIPTRQWWNRHITSFLRI